MTAIRKRMIVTGAHGFLGVRVVGYYARTYEVLGLSHEKCDITKRDEVMNVFKSLCPDVVIHCAALSDTGYSQQHPDESEQINLQGTVNIAEACKRCGAKLIFMSSDQVYNGNAEQGLLPETTILHPVSVYGQHKLEAEKEVLSSFPESVALRLTWMYDLPSSPLKLNRNLVVNLLQAFQNNEILQVATREYRGITSVWDVVKRLDSCINLPGGAYNFGCENELCSYDTFLAAARCMKLANPEQWIHPDTERFPAHPRNLSMSLTKLRQYGIDFPSTQEGFRLALHDTKATN